MVNYNDQSKYIISKGYYAILFDFRRILRLLSAYIIPKNVMFGIPCQQLVLAKKKRLL